MVESLTIGDWSFRSPACRATDLSGLWSAPDLRGEDRTAPGVSGVSVRPRTRGAIGFMVPTVVFGGRDPDGDEFDDVRSGIRANLAEMYEDILPPSSSPYTRELVHELPDGGTRTADCIVTAIEGPNPIGAAAVRVTVVVRIPGGEFVYAESS